MNIFYSIGFYFARAKFELARGYRDGFAPSTGAKDREIHNLLKQDPTANYIAAIKLHRVLYGSSLKDAKNAVDSIRNEL